jgi:dipeptidyl aminopeptidase/acylaminoacyl peptidase
MGANYGGYAAMMGLIKDPDLYRCGIGMLGTTNAARLDTRDIGVDRQSVTYNFKVMVGDPDKMREQFIATSPAAHVEKIRVPVFLANVENGAHLPLIRGEDMRDALVKHKKVHTYMSLPPDERTLAQEETRYRVYRAIEAFLTTYNPAK